jgi:hypothetical protein
MNTFKWVDEHTIAMCFVGCYRNSWLHFTWRLHSNKSAVFLNFVCPNFRLISIIIIIIILVLS